MSWEYEAQQYEQYLWEQYCYEQAQYELYLKYEEECVLHEFEYMMSLEENTVRL